MQSSKMKLWKTLSRRKSLTSLCTEESQLGKVLTILDLTALGVGSTLGVGVYVLAGSVSKDVAGPGVVLSFLYAAIASAFAGICYAEFGARVPKAGSAYAYSYVTIGEFVAFIIGWNLIMEYVIGGASVARGLSLYLDSLMDGQMEKYFRSIISIESDFLSEYFDLFAFTVCVILGFSLAVGLKESMILNNFLTLVNISVVLFVIIFGAFKADITNWKIPKAQVPEWAGEGGFLPYGIFGTIKGAATCFYGYVGFDCIATTGEEVKNPQRAIPLAIIISLTIIFLAYFGVASVLTMLLPYYLQDVNAPIPYAFSQVGWTYAQWTVAIGGTFGLCASMYGGMYPLPRIIYAMSNDGLLFKSLGEVHKKYKTPFIGTILSCVLTATGALLYLLKSNVLLPKRYTRSFNVSFRIMAAAFQLKHLVDMMSMGTLVAYTIVAACVLLLRYRESNEATESRPSRVNEHTRLLTNSNEVTCCSVAKQLFNFGVLTEATKVTSFVASTQIVTFCILSIVLSFCLVQWEMHLIQGSSQHITMCLILASIMLVCLLSICRQPSNTKGLSFKVPLVPILPALSIFLNIYLMMLMDNDTWIRFTVWMIVGLFIYFGYGISNSVEKDSKVVRSVDYDSNGHWAAENEDLVS